MHVRYVHTYLVCCEHEALLPGPDIVAAAEELADINVHAP